MAACIPFMPSERHPVVAPVRTFPSRSPTTTCGILVDSSIISTQAVGSPSCRGVWAMMFQPPHRGARTAPGHEAFVHRAPGRLCRARSPCAGQGGAAIAQALDECYGDVIARFGTQMCRGHRASLASGASTSVSVVFFQPTASARRRWCFFSGRDHHVDWDGPAHIGFLSITSPRAEIKTPLRPLAPLCPQGSRNWQWSETGGFCPEFLAERP